jgi:glutathione S-transferase
VVGRGGQRHGADHADIFSSAAGYLRRCRKSAIKFYEDRLVTQFQAADAQLTGTPYLTGSEITVADLGPYPIYAGRKALIDGAGLKNVTAWGERVGARPSVQKGMKLES